MPKITALSRRTSVPALSVLLVVLALSLASLAAGGDARQFVGRFEISNVSEEGTSVHLTMRLQLFNYSGHDIRQGAVALYTSELRSEAIGGFMPIKLFKNTRSEDITQEFTVPAKEYKRWQEGGVRPALFFLFNDASGKTLKRSVTVSRAILPRSTAQ